MRPDRLAQLERAGLVPRLTEGQRRHLEVFVRALLDPHELLAGWLERRDIPGEQFVQFVRPHEFYGPDARELGRLLAETFGIEVAE